MRLLLLILFFLFFLPDAKSLSDSLPLIKKRKTVLVAGTSVFYAASNSLLYSLWYKDFRNEKFHLFNDNREWMQMDKAGHAFSTYQMGWAYAECMRYAGFEERKSLQAGFWSGIIYMTGIEIMDGFSSGWGFSWGDMGANIGGAAFMATQEKIWKEQRIQLKFSFLPSEYANYRPEILGNNFIQQVIKDYNGQTYWLSLNVKSFCHSKTKIPNWLNLAFGYGANGMISGNESSISQSNAAFHTEFKRYRQFYFSLDADLTRIQVKSKWLKNILRTFNCIKIPFPNLEFSNHQLKGNWF